MIILYIVLAVLAVLLVVLNINAIKCKEAAPTQQVKTEKLTFDEEEKAENLAKLIRCKTISHKDASLDDQNEFIKFKDTLKALYPTVHEVGAPEDIAGGLLFRIKGKSSEKPAVFMAHFDVVDVNADKWEVDPFAGEIKDGFLWGRGTLDTKGSLFGIMEAAELLLKQGFVPENDIYLSFGCNEEVGGKCASTIVKTLKERGIKPDFVLDEGGAVLGANISVFPHDIATIGIAEKGHMDLELTVTGESGHSSQPPVHSAVGMLAKDIVKIENHQFPMEFNSVVKEMCKAIAPHTPYYVRLVLGNLWLFGPLAKIFCKKNKTAAALFRTSMAFTQLWGSNGSNVLAKEAKTNVNVRLAPGWSCERAAAYIKDAAKDENLSARITFANEPTGVTKPEGKYWEILRSCVSANFENTVSAPYLMLGGTDSRYFGEIADNIYKFSPISCKGGLLGTIHSENERMRLDNIPQVINFFADVMVNL